MKDLEGFIERVKRYRETRRNVSEAYPTEIKKLGVKLLKQHSSTELCRQAGLSHSTLHSWKMELHKESESSDIKYSRIKKKGSKISLKSGTISLQDIDTKPACFYLEMPAGHRVFASTAEMMAELIARLT